MAGCLARFLVALAVVWAAITVALLCAVVSVSWRLQDMAALLKDARSAWITPQTIDVAYDAVRVFVKEGVERVRLVERDSDGQIVRVLQAVADVSWDREFWFVMDDLLRDGPTAAAAYARLVVDLGAFDGLVSSNSYNWLELGWDALLVEPFSESMALAKSHTRDFVMRGQHVRYEQAAVTHAATGGVQLLYRQSAFSMQNSLHRDDKAGVLVSEEVKVVPVADLLRDAETPKRFGVLSVDIEGAATEVVAAVLRLDYRPQYIIVEGGNDPAEMRQAGYFTLARVRYNTIYKFNSTGVAA